MRISTVELQDGRIFGIVQVSFFIVSKRILYNHSIDQQVISSADLHNDSDSIVSGRNLHKIQSIDTQTRIPAAARKIMPILIPVCCAFLFVWFYHVLLCQRIDSVLCEAYGVDSQHDFSTYQLINSE